MEAYSILKNGNEKLSEHFKVREFYCRDGSDPVFIDTALVEVLEKIRTHFGKPVTITSRFRTASWNAKQKNAAKFSQHLVGQSQQKNGGACNGACSNVEIHTLLLSCSYSCTSMSDILWFNT